MSKDSKDKSSFNIIKDLASSEDKDFLNRLRQAYSALGDTIAVGEINQIEKALEQRLLQAVQELEDSENATRGEQIIRRDLRNHGGVDYTKLETLLSSGNWEAADRETLECMLKLLGKDRHIRKPWLEVEDLKKIPCYDLLIIDRLWIKYSNWVFGFSIQKKELDNAHQKTYNPKYYESENNSKSQTEKHHSESLKEYLQQVRWCNLSPESHEYRFRFIDSEEFLRQINPLNKYIDKHDFTCNLQEPVIQKVSSIFDNDITRYVQLNGIGLSIGTRYLVGFYPWRVFFANSSYTVKFQRNVFDTFFSRFSECDIH